MAEVKINLLIVENREYVLFEYAQWMLRVLSQSIHKITFYEGIRRPVWFMRRQMIKDALKENAITHILFVDTDVIPPPDFIEKMLAHDLDCVSGVYFQNKKPCSRKNKQPYIGKGLEEVGTFSVGASLIKREVLEKVDYPAPDPIYKTDGDTEFCQALRKAGYKVMQDFDLRCIHFLLSIN